MGANQNPLSFLSQAGMGDFGLTQDSNTNSNAAGSQDGPNVPDLQEILSSSILDAEGKARAMEARAVELGQQDTGGLTDQIFSKRGLLLAALAGGSALAGQPGLATGIGLGGLTKMVENEEGERAALAAAKEQALSERDKALDRADKERNRLANMFNTNPEAFVDPETGKPVMAPEAMGYLITGQDVAIHPTTRRVMQRRDENHKQVTAVMTDALENAQSIEGARQITNELFAHLGDRGQVPGAVKDSIVNAYGTPEFDRVFAATVFKYAGTSGRDAVIAAGQQGLPLNHPDIMAMLDFSKGDVTQPSQQHTAKFLELTDVVRKFQLNPANAELVTALRAETRDASEFNRALVEQALPLVPDQDIYFDKTNLVKDQTAAQWQAQFNDSMGTYDLLETLGQIDVIEEYQNLPDAESKEAFRRNMASNSTTQSHDAQLEGGAQSGARSVSVTISNGAARLVNEVTGYNDVRAGNDSRAIYVSTRKYLQGKNEDVTLEEIQAEFDKQLEKHIEKIKAK